MKFYVYKRPYLNLFLRNVVEWYNVVIFTASLKRLFGRNCWGFFWLFQKLCKSCDRPVGLGWQTPAKAISRIVHHLESYPYQGQKEASVDFQCEFKWFILQDLVHCGFDVKKTVIVDNSPMAYVFDEQNAIPIGHYFATNDNEVSERNLFWKVKVDWLCSQGPRVAGALAHPPLPSLRFRCPLHLESSVTQKPKWPRARRFIWGWKKHIWH